MPADSENQIIVRRVKKNKHGHHGGAWKVAFADFAVAMMAFFLVLWLMEATTAEEKQAISGYFSDPTGFTEGGNPYVIDLEGSTKEGEGEGETPTQDQDQVAQGNVIDEDTVQDLAQQIEYRKFKELRRKLQAKIEENPELEKYKDQIIMEITDDGLQIQIVDKDSRPMFDSGSDEIKPHMRKILYALGRTISNVPNKLSISGHTDAAAFTERQDYSNWELSAERANAARRALQKSGIKQEKVSQVVGLSSSVLFDKDDPMNPVNRRISILVLKDKSAQRIQRQQESAIDEAKLPPDPEFDHEQLPDLPQQEKPVQQEDLTIIVEDEGDLEAQDGHDPFAEFTQETNRKKQPKEKEQANDSEFWE